MLGWLFTAHVVLRWALPLRWALSATLGYAIAGLNYEFVHYIAHTRVRSAFWSMFKTHHMRHHVVSSDYWLGFSLPFIDTIMGTNPDVRDIREEQRKARR